MPNEKRKKIATKTTKNQKHWCLFLVSKTIGASLIVKDIFNRNALQKIQKTQINLQHSKRSKLRGHGIISIQCFHFLWETNKRASYHHNSSLVLNS